MTRVEVRFAGEGGQGLILAAVIFAEAAVASGFNVVQSQQYGPESRGGQTWADVIVSFAEVDYPQATRLDALVALSDKGVASNLALLRPDGLLIADAARLPDLNGLSARRVLLPLAELSRRAAGRAVPPNIAAVGALAAASGLVPLATLAERVVKRVPRGTEAANRRVLEASYAAASAAVEQSGIRPC
jgi:2-oxoglutarate ferredoxin oxidoreductase subunit gamma